MSLEKNPDHSPGFTDIKKKIFKYASMRFTQLSSQFGVVNLAVFLIDHLLYQNGFDFPFRIELSSSSPYYSMLQIFNQDFLELHDILGCSFEKFQDSLVQGQIIFSLKSSAILFLEIRQKECFLCNEEIKQIRILNLLTYLSNDLLSDQFNWLSKELEGKRYYYLRGFYPGAPCQEGNDILFSEATRQLVGAKSRFNVEVSLILQKIFDSCCEFAKIDTSTEGSFFSIYLQEVDIKKLEELVTFDFMETLYLIYRNLSQYPKPMEDCFRYVYPLSCVIMLTDEEASMFEEYKFLFENLDYQKDFFNVEKYLRVELTSGQQVQALQNILKKITQKNDISTMVNLRDSYSKFRINVGHASKLSRKLLSIQKVQDLFSRDNKKDLFPYIAKFHVVKDFNIDEFVKTVEGCVQEQDLKTRDDFFAVLGHLLKKEPSTKPEPF